MHNPSSEFLADVLGHDLCFAVGADTLEFVVLEERVVIGNAVDGCREYMHGPFHLMVQGAGSWSTVRMPSMSVE